MLWHNVWSVFKAQLARSEQWCEFSAVTLMSLGRIVDEQCGEVVGVAWQRTSTHKYSHKHSQVLTRLGVANRHRLTNGYLHCGLSSM